MGEEKGKQPLREYAQKRDFKLTPEPSGFERGSRAKKRARAKTLRFVIQKHRATRLHYDFRLEANGVLASWAVPKGPSLDPQERRLAMHVEDHPFDYRTFEGIIPKGNYGAGEVIVWDEGTYKLADGQDPADEIAGGKIKFLLNGKKLRGEFTLVKIKAQSGESGDPWLLIKDHDQYVDASWRIEQHGESVKSGRDISEIAQMPGAKEWISNRKSAESRATLVKKRAPAPTDIAPMLATAIDAPFDDDEFLFELKWDGFRATATIDRDRNVTLTSRNNKDLLVKFPELSNIGSAFTSLPIIVDGEIVSLDEDGKSSFQRLQNLVESKRRRASRAGRLTYVVFDVLYADGADQRRQTLEQRKALLEQVVRPDHGVMLSKHLVGSGTELFAFAQRRGLEGIIGKRRDSTYVGRRSRDWVKIKAKLEQEFVVGGWTEPRGSRSGFGSLLLGVYESRKLKYVGNVGTGFSHSLLERLHARLKTIERKTPPFDASVAANMQPHWAKPEIIVEVRFTEWTDEGLLRHPAFVGIREDKDAKEVRREVAMPTERVL